MFLKDNFNIVSFTKFWNFLVKDMSSTDFIELRAIGIINNEVYPLIKKFCIKNNIFYKNNCQLFINATTNFGIVIKLIQEKKIINNCKLCYGLCPRQFDRMGNISGGYNHISFATMVFFDIEKIIHTNTTIDEKKRMLVYVYDIIKFLKRYNLNYFTIIDSGAGYHLLYRINRIKLSDSKKRWFANLIEELDSKLCTKEFHFDCLKDFTRIFGLPETMNIKRETKVKIIECANNINTGFKFGVKKKKKVNKKILKSIEEHKIEGNLLKEPLVDFLLNFKHKALQFGGKLSRNHYLELPLACLFRDNNIDVNDIQNIIKGININLNKVIQVNPRYVPVDYNFSKFIVNKWSFSECNILIYK